VDETGRTDPASLAGGHSAVTSETSGVHEELAAELRRTRLLAGMSNSEVARQTGLPRASISRLENGQVLPSLEEVERWGSAVGASERVKERLRLLTQTVATEVIAIRPRPRAGPAAIAEDIRRLEASSAAVRSCEPLLVPGLLQTPEYARRILGSFERPRADLGQATAVRMARQTLLGDPARSFEFIVTEFGLRWSPTGMPLSALRDQLDHISEMAELPNVSVGVIRARVQTKLPLFAFFLYEGVEANESDEEIDVVSLEMPTGAIIVTDPGDIEVYRDYLAWMREDADFSPDAVSKVSG
jgi:transcriptional regulator with XRE-family HTH domain